MKSITGMSFGDVIWRLPSLPPYPINDARYENVIDQRQVGFIVNTLMSKYENIKLNEFFWSYWYAVCAP